MESTVIINYKTRKDYCHCCEQKLPNAKTSGNREFVISKDDVMGSRDWKEVLEFEDDFQSIVEEYIYETISFFATNSYEKIFIENSEFEKVKQLIKHAVQI